MDSEGQGGTAGTVLAADDVKSSPVDTGAVSVEAAEAETGSAEASAATQADAVDSPLASKSVLLGDYSANSRMLLISGIAIIVGMLGAVLAWLIERLIQLATNLFYWHRWSFAPVEAAAHPGRWVAMFMPALGGILVGLIARYLSPAVRGHGMPEAVEEIVFGGAKVRPRVAFLKPIATAISIGSGGPFGAEGPVIGTGGAVGSLLAQFLPVTVAERTVLMVCGAASGWLRPLHALSARCCWPWNCSSSNGGRARWCR